MCFQHRQEESRAMAGSNLDITLVKQHREDQEGKGEVITLDGRRKGRMAFSSLCKAAMSFKKSTYMVV